MFVFCGIIVFGFLGHFIYCQSVFIAFILTFAFLPHYKGEFALINGNCLLNAIVSGSNNINKNKSLVDKLNIFPVPDGDTGTNMSMTMSSAVVELQKAGADLPIGKVASLAASALLRGARGNSGTILSLLFRGFSKGLCDLENATGRDLVNALAIGVDAAYKAVMKPAEGTMLTVARVAFEKGKAASNISDDVVYVWEEICKGATEALATTPDLLPVLKKAGVVDAGGKGLCLIFEGMMSVFKDGTIISGDAPSGGGTAAQIFDDDFGATISAFDEEINFTYCTEFIVGRDASVAALPEDLRTYLEGIGDCVVVVDDDEIIKVHVHTEDPGLALQEALNFGQLLKVKVENMREQNRAVKESSAASLRPSLAPVEPVEEIGFVSVAAGDGLRTLFKDLGCLHVVSGGQTMNPSVEDILQAVMATPARNVFVLPNNKNIILAAEQAVSLCEDRKIIVLPTRTVPQGVAAMLAFNPEANVMENFRLMSAAIEHVKSGQVTFAARDSEYGGFKIKKDDILAFSSGKLLFKSKDPVKAVVKLVHSLADKHTAFVTIIYGHQITENQADSAFKQIQAKLGARVDVTLINGQQPLDYFIVSVE